MVPEKWVRCSKSLIRCKSYIDKLSGPLLDRFAILSYSHKWQQEKNTIPLKDIYKEIKAAQEFALASRQQDKPNSKLTEKEILELTDDSYKELYLPYLKTSYRRQKALLQVARTLADLDASETITDKHIKFAINHTIESFRAIKKIHN